MSVTCFEKNTLFDLSFQSVPNHVPKYVLNVTFRKKAAALNIIKLIDASLIWLCITS